MTKFYTVYLSNTQHGRTDSNGTNILTKSDFTRTDTTITWRLLENSATDKFIQLNNIATAGQDRQMHWNFYDANQTANLSSLITSLNDDIIKQNADNSLLINLGDTQNQMHKKLNEVHYIFEKALVDLTNENNFLGLNENQHTEELERLERLNKLVHDIEGNLGRWFGTHEIEKDYFIVVRHFGNNVDKMYYNLTDGDYELFDLQPTTGDLFLDFFTVGKDLGHAYATRDEELVRRKEVKQQELITSSTCFGLLNETFQTPASEEHKNNVYNDYYKWCESINTKSYGYDHTQPKYNIGRLKLGELVDETFETVTLKIEQYPYISDIEIWED